MNMQTLNLTKKYEKYPEYKDSGVDWLGKIPQEWESRKIKTFSKTLAGGTPATDNVLYWENGTIPWLPSGMIHDNIILRNTKEKYITELGLKESATKVIPKDSVLVALTGATCANISYLTFSATANQSVVAIVNNKKNSLPKYIYYSLLSNREQILIKKTGGAQSGINEQDVKNLFITFPEIDEQTKIANYLEEKTKLIEEIIEKKEKLIELLKEKRTAVINNAVTKGLDKNASLVDSGIEWIGKIPKGWEVEKIKKLSLINKESLSEKTDPNFTFKYFDISSVDEEKDLNFDGEISFDKAPSRARRIINSGDSIIATVRTYLKAIAFFDEIKNPTIASTGFAVLTPKDKLIDKYLFYYLQSDRFINQVIIRSKGISYPAITSFDLGSIEMIYPDKNHQSSIIKYLDTNINNINLFNQKLENSIELLKEFKTSLISNVVTGKIKV